MIWDAEDPGDDVVLKAGFSLAKALCVRQAKVRKAEATDFQSMDAAILAIETDAKRLESMKTWAQTINSHSGRILEEIHKMADGLESQVRLLKDATAGLKRSVDQV